MAPSTKEGQRAELHKTIWRIATGLRGSIDDWDFKSYVLGMLFYRFISENLTAYINRSEYHAGDAGFDYAKLADSQAEFRKNKDSNQEQINDDVVFEIELIKQVEISVDSILTLVQKYRDERGDGEKKQRVIQKLGAFFELSSGGGE